ncbi:MAG: hypothetical protein ABIX12_04055 [Rubrivivax sp.]
MPSTLSLPPRGRLASLWTCAVAAALALPGAATAQAETTNADYDGRWSATVRDASVPTRTARVEIEGYDARWHDRTPHTAANRACAGKMFPVTVQSRSNREIAFTVWGSSVAPACPDFPVVLSPVRPNVLEGRIESGGTVSLKRR